MKCRRAFETDLVAVLRGEGGDVEFLAHYPTCADCTAELRVWGELDGMLRAGAPATAAHPSEETLLAFVDAPATLASETRAEVERHLAGCRACADEVGSLRSQSDVPVAHQAPASHADDVARMPTPGDRASESGWLGRLVWHPAFAYALVVALLVPLVRSNLERLSVPAQFAESERASDATPRAAEEGARDQPASVEAVAPAARPAPVPAMPAEEADELRARQTQPAESARRENDDDRGDLAKRKLASPDMAGGKDEVAEEKAEAANEHAAAEPALADRQQEPPADAFRGGENAPAAQVAAPRAPAGAAAPQDARVMTAPRGALGGGALTPLVELRAGVPATIPLVVAARGPMLQIPTPAAFEGRPIDVRVRAAAGSRELTQRITSRANAIALQIPPQWLATGDYTVTLAPVAPPHAAVTEGDSAAAAPLTFGFAVRAPDTASDGR